MPAHERGYQEPMLNEASYKPVCLTMNEASESLCKNEVSENLMNDPHSCVMKKSME